MNIVTGTFSAVANGTTILVPYGATLEYALQMDIDDAFIGVVKLQRSDHPRTEWATVDEWEGTEAVPLTGELVRATLKVERPEGEYFRFRCNAFQAFQADPPLTASDNVRYAIGEHVASNESGVVKQTVITLVDEPIDLTDDAAVGQYGSIALATMPAGNVMFLGGVVDADIRLVEAAWVDTIPGDVGVGTTAVDNGDALATTEQNIVVTTAVAALVAQAGPINAQSNATLITGAAGGADAPVFLNVRIDDNVAHATGTGRISGTITLTWVNLGDF